MKGRVATLGLILFLLIAPVSLAATLTDVTLYDSTGQKVEILGTIQKTVDIQFTITDVSPSPVSVDLSNFYTRSNLAAIVGSDRQSWLNQNDPLSGYSSSIEVSSYCSYNQDTSAYACRVTGVKLYPSAQSRQSGSLDFGVIVGGESLTQTIAFQTDATPPVAIKFLTEYCTNDGCYLPANYPTNVSLQVQDNYPLEPSYVRFYLEGYGTRSFSTCTGNLCTQRVTLSNCESGDQLTVSLSSGSQDANGNFFEPKEEEFFICDKAAPIINSINLEKPPLPYPNYKNGDTVVITANISEDISGVIAYADLNALQGIELQTDENGQDIPGDLTPGDCNPDGDIEGLYTCVWRVTAVAGTHQMSFIFQDQAGHETLPESKVIIVDEFDDVTTTDELDLFDNVQATPNSPRGYSRLALQVATNNDVDYPIFAEFKPRQKSGTGNVEIIKTFVSRSDCTYNGVPPQAQQDANEQDAQEQTLTASYITNEIKVSDEYFNYQNANARNSLFIKFNQDILDQALSTFSFNCEAQALVKIDGVAYAQPAKFNISVPIILRDSTTNSMGEAYYNRIKRSEDKVTGGLLETASKVGNVVETMQGACRTVEGIVVAGSILSGAEAITTACEQVGTTQAICKPASGVLNGVGSKLGDLTNGIFKGDLLGIEAGEIGLDKIPLQGIKEDDNILTAACKLATCSGDERLTDQLKEKYGVNTDILDVEDIVGKPDESGDYWGGVYNGFREDLTAGVGKPNSQQSLLSSINTMCLPGIVYHVEKFRQMECEQLACYKWSAAIGLDVSVCDQAKARSMCMATFGELAELSPTKSAEDLLDNFNAVIQNSVPAALKNFVGTAACKTTENADFVTNVPNPVVRLGLVLTCKIPKTVAQISYQVSDNAGNNGNFQYPPYDVCEFALCNGDSLEDCSSQDTPAPPYLQQYVQINRDLVPPQKLPNYFNLPAGEVASQFDALRGKPSFTDDEIKIIRAYEKRTGTETRDDSIRFKNQEEAFEHYRKVANQVFNTAVAADSLGLPVRVTPDGPSVDVSQYKIGSGPTLEELGILASNAVRDLERKTEDLSHSIGDENSKFFIDNSVDITGYNEQTGEVSYVTFDKDDNIQTGTMKLSKRQYEKVKQFQESEQNALNTEYTLEQNKQGAVTELENKLKEKFGDEDIPTSVKQDVEKIEGMTPEEFKLDKEKKIDQAVQLGLDVTINMGVQWAYQQGILDALQWDDTLGWTFVNDLGQYLNSQQRRASICDDIVTINAASEYSANVVQCDNANFCVPVLSFAAEKIENVDGKFVYTMHWSVGNVADLDPTQRQTEKFVRYNVYLVGPADEYALHQEGSWAEIPYGQQNDNDGNYFDNIDTSFVTSKEYDKICFRFDKPFPPTGSGNRRDEICRPIHDAEISSAFNTGEPVNENYQQNTGTNTNNPNGFNVQVPQE